VSTVIAEVWSLTSSFAVSLYKTSLELFVFYFDQTALSIHQNIFASYALGLQGKSHAVYAAAAVVRSAVAVTSTRSCRANVTPTVVDAGGTTFCRTAGFIDGLEQRIELESEVRNEFLGKLQFRRQEFIRLEDHQTEQSVFMELRSMFQILLLGEHFSTEHAVELSAVALFGAVLNQQSLHYQLLTTSVRARQWCCHELFFEIVTNLESRGRPPAVTTSPPGLHLSLETFPAKVVVAAVSFHGLVGDFHADGAALIY